MFAAHRTVNGLTGHLEEWIGPSGAWRRNVLTVTSSISGATRPIRSRSRSPGMAGPAPDTAPADRRIAGIFAARSSVHYDSSNEPKKIERFKATHYPKDGVPTLSLSPLP